MSVRGIWKFQSVTQTPVLCVFGMLPEAKIHVSGFCIPKFYHYCIHLIPRHPKQTSIRATLSLVLCMSMLASRIIDSFQNIKWLPSKIERPTDRLSPQALLLWLSVTITTWFTFGNLAQGSPVTAVLNLDFNNLSANLAFLPCIFFTSSFLTPLQSKLI